MKSITKAKVNGEIVSGAADSRGKPMWILKKDGGILLSEQAVNEATIQSLRIRA